MDRRSTLLGKPFDWKEKFFFLRRNLYAGHAVNMFGFGIIVLHQIWASFGLGRKNGNDRTSSNGAELFF